MSSPAEDSDPKPEKIEQGGTQHCDLYDMDIVHKIAQEFLPGLGSACIDNTTGGLFSSPANVAVGIRREMIDYLIQRSENYVAESVVLETGPNEEISKDPYDIISDFIDDFASSKRNFFSRVSAWLLSDRRDDKIDDFVQEMDVNGFWLLSRRESIGQTLLKNVDVKNLYHCSMSFNSPEELEEHKSTCNFRTMICEHEGCNSRFSAVQKDHHDSICPFKILQCEQNCSENIMRRDMDRHCITVCSMKLVKCPFHSVGCHSSIPQSTVGEHRLEDLSSHLLCILQIIHKDASVGDLKERVDELIQLSSPEQLAAFRDARSLTHAIKDLEAKLGPLKIKSPIKTDDRASESSDKKEEDDSPAKEAAKSGESSPSATIDIVVSPSKTSVNEDPSKENEKLVESPTNAVKELPESETPNNINSEVSLTEQEDSKESVSDKEGELENPSEEKVTVTEPDKDELVTLSVREEEHNAVASAALESQAKNENTVVTEEHVQEPTNSDVEPKKEESEPEDAQHSSPINVEEQTDSVTIDGGNNTGSTTGDEIKNPSTTDDENKKAPESPSNTEGLSL